MPIINNVGILMGAMTKSKEDYLRVLYENLKIDTMVKSKDLANQLNFSRPSVSRMMTILKKSGYIEMEKYGLIKLTRKGQNYAADIEKRRSIIKTFLIDIINLDEKSANEEACRIEHAISSRTAEKLGKLNKILIECVKNNV